MWKNRLSTKLGAKITAHPDFCPNDAGVLQSTELITSVITCGNIGLPLSTMINQTAKEGPCFEHYVLNTKGCRKIGIWRRLVKSRFLQFSSIFGLKTEILFSQKSLLVLRSKLRMIGWRFLWASHWDINLAQHFLVKNQINGLPFPLSLTILIPI